MKRLALLKGIYFFARLARDPNELDRVFQLRNSGVDPVYKAKMVAELRKLPGANEAFATRPRLGTLDMPALRTLPSGTFGHAYAKFMDERGLSPDSLPQPSVSTDGEYVTAHMYESHDLWHVVTGFDSDPAGEAGLQAVYAAQMPGPLPAALVSALLLNAAIERDGKKMKQRFDAVARGWRMGRRAKLLFGVRWADLWSTPLSDVRAMLNVEIEDPSAPVIPISTAA